MPHRGDIRVGRIPVPADVILVAVLWYLRYLSNCDVEEHVFERRGSRSTFLGLDSRGAAHGTYSGKLDCRDVLTKSQCRPSR